MGWGKGGGRIARGGKAREPCPLPPRPLSQDVESICPSLQNDWTAARPGHPSSHCARKLALLKASSPLKFYSFPFLWEFLCCAACRTVFRFAAYQRNYILLLWQTQNPGSKGRIKKIKAHFYQNTQLSAFHWVRISCIWYSRCCINIPLLYLQCFLREKFHPVNKASTLLMSVCTQKRFLFFIIKVVKMILL